MPTDCSNAQITFEGFEGRQVVGSFDGGAVTSNAGALLLREADRIIGLTRRVCGAIRDGRLQDAVVHALPTLVAQRIHAIALDYEDVNDHDELRHDPALALLSDTLEPKRTDVAVLAGKSTLQRFEQAAKTGSARYHKFDVDDAMMDRVFLDIYIGGHKRPPRKIRLDVDATDIPLHGDQEGKFFHGLYEATAVKRFFRGFIISPFLAFYKVLTGERNSALIGTAAPLLGRASSQPPKPGRGHAEGVRG